MKKEKTRLLSITLQLALFVALAFGVFWLVKNFDSIRAGLSGADLYTIEAVEEARQQERDKWLEEKNYYESYMQSFQGLLSQEQQKYNAVLFELEAEKSAAVLDKDKIARLELEASNSATYIASLESNLAIMENNINALQESLDEMIDMLDLQNTAIIRFEKDGEIAKAILFDKEAVFDTSVFSVEKEGHVFKGWTIDGENVLSEITITENITLKAKFAATYNVKYILRHPYAPTGLVPVGEEIVIGNEVFESGHLVIPQVQIPTFENWTFNEWVRDVPAGVNEPLGDNFEITRDITVIASYKEDNFRNVIFKLDNEILNQQKVYYETENLQEIEDVSNYYADEDMTFKGWENGGEFYTLDYILATDLTSFSTEEVYNIVFVATFEATQNILLDITSLNQVEAESAFLNYATNDAYLSLTVKSDALKTLYISSKSSWKMPVVFDGVNVVFKERGMVFQSNVVFKNSVEFMPTDTTGNSTTDIYYRFIDGFEVLGNFKIHPSAIIQMRSGDFKIETSNTKEIMSASLNFWPTSSTARLYINLEGLIWNTASGNPWFRTIGNLYNSSTLQLHARVTVVS